MRKWRMGTLTLGLILIALGCGFVLSKLGIISSIVQVLSWWPLAIILLGIEVLLGGFLFSDERSRLKFDGFSVIAILLTFFICAGSFIASTVPWGKLNLNLPSNSLFYKDSSIFQKQITINASGKEGILLNNSIGNVQLLKTSGNNIEIEASIKISHNDYEYAKSVPDNLIKVTEGNTINITSDKGQLSNDKVNIQSIDYRIKIPEKLNVEIINKFGKVEAENISGNLKVDNTNGSINVKSITGSLAIDNKFGEISASEITGSARITNSNGRITANDFKSDLIIENKFGDVIASNIRGKLKISDSNGKIKTENTDSSLIIDNQFGGIELINTLGSVDVKNENGAISLTSDQVLQNDVKIQGKFGSITLNLNNQQEGSFSLLSRQGSIKSEFPINTSKNNTTESSNAMIGSSKTKIDIRNENGNITINKN